MKISSSECNLHDELFYYTYLDFYIIRSFGIRWPTFDLSSLFDFQTHAWFATSIEHTLRIHILSSSSQCKVQRMADTVSKIHVTIVIDISRAQPFKFNKIWNFIGHVQKTFIMQLFGMLLQAYAHYTYIFDGARLLRSHEFHFVIVLFLFLVASLFRHLVRA